MGWNENRVNAPLIIEDFSYSIKKSVGNFKSSKRIISGLAWKPLSVRIAANTLVWLTLREHQRSLTFLREVDVKIDVIPRLNDEFAKISGKNIRANTLIKSIFNKT